MMERTAADIKNQLMLNLLIQVLEEHGIMTEQELQDRLTNTIKLSSLDANLKQEVLQEIQHH
ncbi:MAG: hypothetical protein ACI35P_10560 [Bacillus sp. (in: firmicutes)]